MKYLTLLIPVGLASFVAWIFWGPLLGFLISLIPSTAECAWVGKLICVILVGWLGGIALPLVILIIGIWFILSII